MAKRKTKESETHRTLKQDCQTLLQNPSSGKFHYGLVRLEMFYRHEIKTEVGRIPSFRVDS